jgi:hypothetical protein
MVTPIVKDDTRQTPVPDAWRPTLAAIAEAFCEGDFELARGIQDVSPVAPEDAQRIAENIEDYGDELASLPMKPGRPRYATGWTATGMCWSTCTR